MIPEIYNFLQTNKISNVTPKNNNTDFIYDKEYDIDNKVFPDYKYFYNNQLFEEVYKLYENDFRLFDYTKNSLN